MKTATFFLASVLVFLFTTHLVSSMTTADGDIIYDVEGNELQSGVPYYIAPAIPEPLRGMVSLDRASGNNQTFELDVVLERFGGGLRIPFTFTPVSTNEPVIRSSYPLAIDSPFVNPFNESMIWRVTNREGLFFQILTTGGYSNVLESCFRINKPEHPLVGYSYIFEHCPFLCGPSIRFCYPIGLYERNGTSTRHLSVYGTRPFEVVFHKAPEPVIAIK